ncbi:MAG TPA: SMP-30/gluconolactonase/LRE family protein [Candidatus Limiplasma sp.]|nr:SMP-30/gluconolactonase/LRE family protein [Candidatus Limiplasma sp.]HRX07722.1 SMP-30/gluconolactonase/LRE family protein [Candidatus Limiplasma sp.]
MKTYPQAELVFDAQAELGESVLWNGENATLHWVDIHRCTVHSLRLLTGEHTWLDTAQAVGAIVPAQGGGFAAAMAAGIYLLDDQGAVRRIAQPQELVPLLRFNDGKCDRKGRFWAGTQIMRGSMTGKGFFWCLDLDGTVRTMLTGVTTSNGLAWNHDDTVLYYIDTMTFTVRAFPFDLEHGTLGEGRVCVRVPGEYGYPDGMTIDREGMLWIAHWQGSAVRRYDPRTGECIGMLPVPASKVTSCCFGGENLDTLYITTAREGADLNAEPLAGGIFKANVGASGYEAFAYRGIRD